MYLRLKNSLDVQVLMMDEEMRSKEMQPIVDRISELIEMLDVSYGEHRRAFDMGGYILLFTTHENYAKAINRICEFYHICVEEREYSETIATEESEKVWMEDLYMLSSDDAIMLIYSQE